MNNLVEAEPGQRARAIGGEERTRGWWRDGCLLQHLRDRLDGLRPQRTGAPFISFAVQPHARLWSQIKMLDTKLGDLLHAGTRVVQHQKERAVPPRVPSVCRQAVQEHLDVLALQIEGFGRRRALDGDGRYLLRHRQVLRIPAREKVEEGAQNGQPVIPRAPMIASRGFKVLQKSKHAIERERLAGDLRDSTRHVLGDEQKKETKPVTVRLDGGRPEPPLDGELVDEKRLDERAYWCAHGVTSLTLPWAHCSNRALASPSSAGVIVR
jgi:hypothetical protein